MILAMASVMISGAIHEIKAKTVEPTVTLADRNSPSSNKVGTVESETVESKIVVDAIKKTGLLWVP